MTIVLGIDPGASGAFALYDTATLRLAGDIVDMPTWFQQVGRNKRLRLDPIAIAEYFDNLTYLNVELIVMENVGGRAKQSASAAYTFGYGTGMLYMAAIYTRIPIETVLPQTWKKQLNVPGKQKADDSAIMARANELFPHDRAQFYGARGGKRVDRAEAAMMAKYGGDYLYPSVKDAVDIETLARNADTGA